MQGNKAFKQMYSYGIMQGGDATELRLAMIKALTSQTRNRVTRDLRELPLWLIETFHRPFNWYKRNRTMYVIIQLRPNPWIAFHLYWAALLRQEVDSLRRYFLEGKMAFGYYALAYGKIMNNHQTTDQWDERCINDLSLIHI